MVEDKVTKLINSTRSFLEGAIVLEDDPGSSEMGVYLNSKMCCLGKSIPES
jgi:hypothetical protein